MILFRDPLQGGSKLLKIFRRFFYGVLTVLLILALHQAPNHKVDKAKQIELRSVWLTNFGTAFLHHTTRLDEVLYNLATLNFNTIYPCVSISPNPSGFAYREYLQDWSRWVQKGIIDEVVVQVYRDTTRDVEAVLRQRSLRRASALVPTSIGLYSGSFRDRRSIEQMAKQVEVVRN